MNGYATAVVSAIELTGVNQSTPLGTVSTSSPTTSPYSISPSTSLGNVTVDLWCGQNSAPTISGGQTAIWSHASSNGNNQSPYCASSYKSSSASSTTMSYTGSNQNAGMLAIDVVSITGSSVNSQIEAMRLTSASQLLKLPVRANGTTPTCNSGNDGGIALTYAYIMCVCKGGSSAWVKTSDGSTSCTF
jgi:hypothetical protein